MKALLELRCGGVPATYLSSQQGVRERRAVMDELAAAAPTCKLLYVTPEQLVKSAQLVSVLQGLSRRGLLARLVIDEARPPPLLPGPRPVPSHMACCVECPAP